jgi:subtilase family serine protease
MNPETPARRAFVTSLAVVGFIALVVLGLWLAVYLARSLSGEGGLGAVADYIGAMFTPRTDPALSVVPTASTTISFGESTTTDASAGTGATSTATTTAKKTVAATYPTYYRTATTTYPVTGATRVRTTPTYTGNPDLIVTIVSVGYINSSGDFVASSTIDDSDDLAAVILVTNIGTNKSGPWDIKVSVPTSSDATFTRTETMASLEPSQPVTIDLKLTKGTPRTGTNDIIVTVDPDNDIVESKETNNAATKSITVK